MSINLSKAPMAAIRKHVGSYIYWTYERDDGRFMGGWGQLKRVETRELLIDDKGYEFTLKRRDLLTIEVAQPRTIPPTFMDLRAGFLIGIVDSNGAVDSRFVGYDRLGKSEQHSTFWPGHTHGRWRWRFDGSLTAFVEESAPLPDEWEPIRTHITKRYGIRFWDTGYHDMDHFLAHLTAEREAAKAAGLPIDEW